MSEITNLEDVLAGVDTVMTVGLVRLFKVAGCSPTACHCCGKQIKAGQVFKLIPHKGTDEMCCVNCGERQLIARDEKAKKARGSSPSYPLRLSGRGWAGGYSRPSKEPT